MVRGVGYAISASGRRKPRLYAVTADQDLASRVDRNGLRGAPGRAAKQIGEYDVAIGVELGHKGSLVGRTCRRRPQIAAAGDGKIRRDGGAGDIRAAGAIA